MGYKGREHSERKLREDFDLGASRTATVDWYVPTEAEVTESIADGDRNTEYHTECVEADVIEEFTDDIEKDGAKNTNQTVFINNGSGVQIGINYGTINLPSHKTENDG